MLHARPSRARGTYPTKPRPGLTSTRRSGRSNQRRQAEIELSAYWQGQSAIVTLCPGMPVRAPLSELVRRMNGSFGSNATGRLTPCSTRSPLRPDCVEEVGALAVLGGVRRRARRSLFAIRSASGRAAGPALPAFGDSGRWQPAGTRLEHQMDLSA